jgi:hypothetical protein
VVVVDGNTGDPNPDYPTRPAADDTAAMAVVVGASWPTGYHPGPVERRTLARAARPCLDRGHTPTAVRQAMTGNLDGARNIVAVITRRLAELAATEPDPAPAPGRAETTRRPHPYADNGHGRCADCGAHEHTRIHPATRTAARQRCQHGRHPQGCPHCRTWTPPGTNPTTPSRPGGTPTPAPARGIAALDQALAQMYADPAAPGAVASAGARDASHLDPGDPSRQAPCDGLPAQRGQLTGTGVA